VNTDTNTGGPAFPDPQENWRGEKGMTLRDYFAAKAMEQVDWSSTGVIAGAETCYELADAMLKARET
jgi:hypothetical protein